MLCSKEDVFEVILLENGSKDNSPSICDEYSEKFSNVKTIHRGKIGLYSARQTGIKAAEGDWIIALDADDRLRPDALSKLYDAIKRYGSMGKTPDIILFDAAGMGSTAKKLFVRPFEPDKVCEGKDKRIFMEKLCMDDSINSMWTKCINKRIAYLGKTDLFLNYGEDLYQTAEYLDRAGSVVYLDEILYYYREGAVSLSSTYSEMYVDNQKITWGKLDEKVEKWGLNPLTETICRRKALTCTIAVTKLIYSDMPFEEKRHKLSKLLSDDFYIKYYSYELPDWAPEESVFVRKLQMAKNDKTALLFNGAKRSVKNWVKERIRNGI